MTIQQVAYATSYSVGTISAKAQAVHAATVIQYQCDCDGGGVPKLG